MLVLKLQMGEQVDKPSRRSRTPQAPSRGKACPDPAVGGLGAGTACVGTGTQALGRIARTLLGVGRAEHV